MENGQNNLRPFGMKDKLGYMFGNFGNDFTFQLASSYLLVFYTKVLGIKAGIVGTLFLLAKCLDAFTDVAMGNICDNRKTGKNGKFRPWLKYMAIPVAVSSTLMYNYFIADWNMTAKMIYVVVTYILWGSICYTGVNIPYGSMASVITSDSVQRTSLSTFRSLGSMAAAIFVGTLAPQLLYTKDSAGNSIVTGERFLIVAVAFSILAVACYMVCYNFCQERIVLPHVEKEKNTKVFKDAKNLFKDSAFIVVIISALLTIMASSVMQVLNQYLFMDYFGDAGKLSIVNLISVGAMIVTAPFTGKITKKFGKKIAGGVTLLISGITYVIVFVLHVENTSLYMALLFIANLTMGYFSMVSYAYVTDVIDHYQIKTGQRKDGTVYAVYSFVRKLGQAFAGATGGWVLAIIGYNSLATVQTTAVKNSIFAMCMLVPAICYIISGVLMLVIYPLSKEKVKENQEIIESQKQQ